MATPTWEYVQQVISDNIDKADLASGVAERGLEELQAAITALPFSTVDTSIGTAVTLEWNDIPTIGETVIPEWTATVSDASVATEPDYSAEVLPDVSIGSISVPSGVSGPIDDITFSEPTDPRPIMGAKIFAGAPAESTTTPIGFGPPSALPDVAGSLKALLSAETGGFSPDSSLSSALGSFAAKIATAASAFNLDHPWGSDWEGTAYPLMQQRADEVRRQLFNILNDPATQGLPSAYWEQLATEAAARISRKKVGALRRAQNGGAASYWGLPTEAMLALAQSAEQDASEELQSIEGEIAKKRTELVREAYFKAIDVLVDMERWMIATAESTRKLAVDIFNALFGARVQMYNANLAQFEQVFKQVGMNIDALTTDNKMALEAWASRLKAMEATLEADKTTAQIFSTETEAWKVGRQTHYEGIDEQIKLWAAKVDGAVKFEGLKLDKEKTDLEHYKSVVAKVQGLASAAAQLLSARATALNAQLEADKTAVQLDTAKNSTAIERARLNITAQQAVAQLGLQLDTAKNEGSLKKATLNQQAQETNAKLEISQSEFVSEKTIAILQAVAASRVGMYQALLQMSDVGLKSDWSGSSREDTSASRNQAIVW